MATINDIAKMAGVSAATVSHVVNNTRFVSPELRERVEKAIAEADIPPNFVIRKRKSKHLQDEKTPEFVLFLTSDTQNPFDIELEHYLCENLKIRGYLLLTLNFRGQGKVELLTNLLTNNDKVVGIVISADACEERESRFINGFDVPKVVIGNKIKEVESDRVYSDNFGGAYKATIHLIRSGHEQIALLCGKSNSESNIERISGFKKALMENDIEIENSFVTSDLETEDEVCKKLKQILKSEAPPSAIFVANYKNLLATFKYMNRKNIECPKDVSIVGFNDFDWAPILLPPVTTVAQNTKQLCKNAVELLIDNIEKQNDEKWYKYQNEFKQVKIPTELRVRNSTCGIGRGPFGEKAADVSQMQLSEEDIKKCTNGNFTAAISFHYSGKSWMKLHEQGIRNIFDSLNISLIAITDAHFDPELQNKQLKSIMMLEPDVLIAIPTDNAKTSETFKKIAKTNTGLIFISNVPEGIERKDYISCVSVNERSHGRYIGRGLGEYMSETGRTKIGMLKHGADFYTTNQRDAAGEQILTEEYPELEICDIEYFNSEEEAYELTIKMLKENNEIEGIYVSWEGPAQYVMSALNDIQRQDVAISTGDLEFNLALNMAKGGMVKAISAQCPYEQGQALALCAANALTGKKVPSFIGIEPIYVEKYNLIKSWQQVYKEEAPEQLVDILK